MRIGDIEIQPLIDGSTWEWPDDMLVREGVEDAWACHADKLDHEGHISMDVGGFLIRSGDRIALIDAGFGPLERGRHKGGRFLESLRAQGVDPEDVTDVLFTHLHYDHVGWGAQQGRIVFPNATYRVHRADWEHFVESPDALEGAIRKLSPLESQLELFDEDQTLLPGVDSRLAAGHTPGHTVYVLSSRDERALLLGDLIHSVVELTEPDWKVLIDIDPAAAAAVREEIATELMRTGDLTAAAHFPELRFGRLIGAEGDTRKFTFV